MDDFYHFINIWFAENNFPSDKTQFSFGGHFVSGAITPFPPTTIFLDFLGLL